MNTIGDYKNPKHVTDKIFWNSDRKREENGYKTINQTSEYDFYMKIGHVISTIGARRIKQNILIQ